VIYSSQLTVWVLVCSHHSSTIGHLTHFDLSTSL